MPVAERPVVSTPLRGLALGCGGSSPGGPLNKPRPRGDGSSTAERHSEGDRARWRLHAVSPFRQVNGDLGAQRGVEVAGSYRVKWGGGER
jgi:hypothetical protein